MSIAQYYTGKRAKNYDAERQNQPKWKFETAILEAIHEKINPEVKSVIDAPVGSGRFLNTYIQTRVTGFDYSSDMLEVAKQRGTKAKLLLHNLIGDALPVSADLVVCFRFLNLISVSDADAALTNLLNSARKYAVFTLRTVPDDYDQPLFVGRVKLHLNGPMLALIDHLGFEVVERFHFEDNVPGNYDIFFCKRTRKRNGKPSNLPNDNPQPD